MNLKVTLKRLIIDKVYTWSSYQQRIVRPHYDKNHLAYFSSLPTMFLRINLAEQLKRKTFAINFQICFTKRNPTTDHKFYESRFSNKSIAILIHTILSLLQRIDRSITNRSIINQNTRWSSSEFKLATMKFRSFAVQSFFINHQNLDRIRRSQILKIIINMPDCAGIQMIRYINFLFSHQFELDSFSQIRKHDGHMKSSYVRSQTQWLFFKQSNLKLCHTIAPIKYKFKFKSNLVFDVVHYISLT